MADAGTESYLPGALHAFPPGTSIVMKDLSRSLPSATPAAPTQSRRMPIGAELIAPGQVAIRVWAPEHQRVVVVMDDQHSRLVKDADGYHAATVAGRPGSRYGLLVDQDSTPYPDPASRAQPDGPHGLSEVVDPDDFSWRDAAWSGPDEDAAVLYEMHVGTFTPEGTFAAAASHLEHLATLGITVIQLMPVADFPGAFGWGYDSVCLYAPNHVYGRPDDLRRFVDQAHAFGLAVILDVVYNHVGPDGNYLRAFSQRYFSDRYENEWGEALNFDGPDAAPVREWVLTNVAYWIREFHVDGFRLDATQQIFDASPDHLLAAVARAARATAGHRRVLITAENEPQQVRLVEDPADGGYGLDALYNDDFHHSARVALVGTREAYLGDYRGVTSEWLACARWGFLFQGQLYAWQKQGRGTPSLDLPPRAFVNFLENHDQVANTDSGRRLVDLARPSDLRAMTALHLLLPGLPLIFQGQEFGAREPFVYFADHQVPLADAVAAGRREFLQQFERLRDDRVFEHQPAPHHPSAFTACRLQRDPSDRRQQQWTALYRDLLALRRARPRHAGQPPVIDGAAPDSGLLLLRYRAGVQGDWLIVLNLAADRDIASLSEPLIAPPRGGTWWVHWSSEAPRYGGQGVMAWTSGHWPVAGHSLTVVAPGATAPATPEVAR